MNLTTEVTEAEVRRLALDVREQWAGMASMIPPHLMARDRLAEADACAARYRESVRRLTAALLAYPAAVRLDAETLLLPNAEGDGPAFVPDPDQCGNPREARRLRNRLDRLVEVHRRRHDLPTDADRRWWAARAVDGFRVDGEPDPTDLRARTVTPLVHFLETDEPRNGGN